MKVNNGIMGRKAGPHRLLISSFPNAQRSKQSEKRLARKKISAPEAHRRTGADHLCGC